MSHRNLPKSWCSELLLVFFTLSINLKILNKMAMFALIVENIHKVPQPLEEQRKG